MSEVKNLIKGVGINDVDEVGISREKSYLIWSTILDRCYLNHNRKGGLRTKVARFQKNG